MKAYGYTAYTDDGRRRSGQIVAETEADAAQKLAAQGLFVSDVTARAARAGRLRRGRLGPDLQAVFTRQMAVLMAADLPAEAALTSVETAGGAGMARVAAEARAAVLDGAPLSEALEHGGGGFPPYYIAALRAGEGAGDVAAVFGVLADHLEALGSDKAQIWTALIYPAFVAAVSLLVCAILMVSVAPEIVAMFQQAGRPLPGLTLAVLGLSDWIGARWLPLSVLGLGLVALGLASGRVPGLRAWRDRALLRLPLVGRMMRLSAAVQYMRTLALVLGSRQAVLGAVDNAREVLSVAAFRAEAAAVTEAVRQGETLSAALTRLSVIPPVARQLIQAGEASVRLARMTERAATLVESGLTTERKRIAALLEPLLMMLVGALVLTIVMAVLLPIFDLQSMVAG